MTPPSPQAGGTVAQARTQAPASFAGALLARLPLIVALVAHVFVVFALFALFARRVAHPVEIGNVEGLLMEESLRIAHGQPLYVAPSLAFTPLAYMPGYMVVVALMTKLFGPALWVGRAVSLAEVVALAGILGVAAWRETRSRVLAVAAVGLFVSSFGPTGGSFDLMQTNTQMLLLAFAGVAILRWTRGQAGAVLSAAVFAASFFTKQHGLMFGLAMLPWLMARDRRRAATFGAALLVFAGGGFALLTARLGPWFPFYTYDVPSHWSKFDHVKVELFLGTTVFGDLAMSTLMALIAIAAGLRVWKADTAIWWWAGLGGVAASLMATLDPYAYRHTLMPVFVAAAVLAPIATHRMFRAIGLEPGRATAWAAGLLLAQYLGILYPLRVYLPRHSGADAGQVFEARLRSLPGGVWVPDHGWYAGRAGKGTGMHMLALDDIIRSHGNALLRRDPRYLTRMFDSLATSPGRPWLVMDRPLSESGDVSRPLWESLEPHYRMVEDMGEALDGLRPLAGLRNGPRYLYAPVDSGATTP